MELDEFLCAREKAGTLGQLAPVLAQQGGRLFWQLVMHVERCYWALPAHKLQSTKKPLNQKVSPPACCNTSLAYSRLAITGIICFEGRHMVCPPCCSALL